jgi:hypothetical protein
VSRPQARTQERLPPTSVAKFAKLAAKSDSLWSQAAWSVRQPQARFKSLEHDAEKWVPVFGKTSCSKKKLERDDGSVITL